MRKPNFFILGAAKCGTSSLWDYLAKHPEVCVSEPKEPFFFEAEYERGLDYYWQRYFSCWRGEQAVGEARHRNLYLSYIPQRIADSVPDAKLIVTLRHPIERAFSHWWDSYSRGLEKLDFTAAIEADMLRIEKKREFVGDAGADAWTRQLDFKTGTNEYRTYVDSGYYCEQIQRYLRHFPAENLTIVFLEDLAADPHDTINGLWSFLGVDPAEVEEAIAFKPQNEAKSSSYALKKRQQEKAGRSLPVSLLPSALRKLMFKRPEMCPDLRSSLASHFKPHNEALEKLTGRDLSLWDC